MDDLSKEYVTSFFSKRLHRFGDTPEALAWSAGGQIERYQSLLDIDTGIDGRKVLDFGCGTGGLYAFLRDQRIHVNYTGVDINKELISVAQKKYPECRFRAFDIDREDIGDEYDYIFLCGVFNLKVQGLVDTIPETLKALFRYCRVAMAFNALSAHDPQKNFELNYLYPDEIFRFAVQELSPYAVLRHDRVPYDFNLFVYKNRNTQRP